MEKMVKKNNNFWAEKRVLITGHTGFKGAWLSLWLNSLGAHVTGISLPPVKSPNLFELARVGEQMKSLFCDIRDSKVLSNAVIEIQPELVFNLAAQSLVRPGYQRPIETFDTNLMGTVNLLEALRQVRSVRSVVMVTTDKVYRNLERPYPYKEDDALGGRDPYSASKAASELLIDCYRDAFLKHVGVPVASARAGNVIGGGDWSEDRLIPDAVRAWQSGRALEVRNPESTRPWQHVLEPLHGYLILAERLWAEPELQGAYNFGPRTQEVASVREVIGQARTTFGRGEVEFVTTSGPHEAGYLALESAKSRSVLGIEPKWGLSETVIRTMNWYKGLEEGQDANSLCLKEIQEYGASTCED